MAQVENNASRHLTLVVEWFLRARHKFIWDLETISPYIDVLGEVVYCAIADRLSENGKKVSWERPGPPSPVLAAYHDLSSGTFESIATPEIGYYPFRQEHSQEDKLDGYALYVAELRLPPDRRSTLFARVKELYKYAVGSGPNHWPEWVKVPRTDERKQTILERKKLVRNFNSLANRSLNRRRTISAHLKYQVLMRDNSTCQVCGRRAPEVRLHVDHITPLSWDTSWQPSDDPDDYQVLCEECNLGKGSLSWLTMA